MYENVENMEPQYRKDVIIAMKREEGSNELLVTIGVANAWNKPKIYPESLSLPMDLMDVDKLKLEEAGKGASKKI